MTPLTNIKVKHIKIWVRDLNSCHLDHVGTLFNARLQREQLSTINLTSFLMLFIYYESSCWLAGRLGVIFVVKWLLQSVSDTDSLQRKWQTCKQEHCLLTKWRKRWKCVYVWEGKTLFVVNVWVPRERERERMELFSGRGWRLVPSSPNLVIVLASWLFLYATAYHLGRSVLQYYYQKVFFYLI